MRTGGACGAKERRRDTRHCCSRTSESAGGQRDQCSTSAIADTFSCRYSSIESSLRHLASTTMSRFFKKAGDSDSDSVPAPVIGCRILFLLFAANPNPVAVGGSLHSIMTDLRVSPRAGSLESGAWSSTSGSTNYLQSRQPAETQENRV